MNILIVSTGSVAVVKVNEIAQLLHAEDHDVVVIPTKSAFKINPLVFIDHIMSNLIRGIRYKMQGKILHIESAKWVDTVLVAPATYNFVGKMAGGIADDFASTIIAAIPRGIDVFVAPAMNTEMYNKPVLQHNLELLKSRGYIIIPPRHGKLACGDTGIGALERPQKIVNIILKYQKKV